MSLHQETTPLHGSLTPRLSQYFPSRRSLTNFQRFNVTLVANTRWRDHDIPAHVIFFFELGNEYVAIAILIDDKSLNKNAAFDDLLNNVQLDLDTMISGLDISYYWEYTGSFTTPNCEENVQWLILRDVIEVTTAQIEQMKTISGLDSSFRDPMPLNGRAVNDGSKIVSVTVVWFVIVGRCSEQEARQFSTSIGAVLGLSAEEMVVVHILKTHGGDRTPGPTEVWDIHWKLHVIDNTKTFVDRVLENVGVDGTANGNVTDAIKKHYNETAGTVPGFYPVRATIMSDDDGIEDYIIIIVVGVIILLCFAVAIMIYLRKGKMEKSIVEITVGDGMSSQTKM